MKCFQKEEKSNKLGIRCHSDGFNTVRNPSLEKSKEFEEEEEL